MHTSENTPLFQEPIGFGVTYLFPRTKKASKIWRQTASGWAVEGFGNSKVFDSGAIAVDSPAKFFDFLDQASRKPCFLIRGQLRPGIAPDGVRRTLYAKGEAPAYFEEVPRRFVAIDADKVTVPGADVFNDPEYVADYVRGMLPAEFQDVACFVQLSSSAGMSPTGKTLSDVVSLRLWFCTEQAYGSDQLRRWAAAVNNKLGLRLVDPALCNAIQAHYIAAPTFLDAKGAALPDILPRRCFVLDGIEDRIEALEIPAVAPRIERLPGEGGSFDGADVQACLERIGDDRAGYQLPILHACIAAVRSKGKDLDDAAFIRSVQAAVLTANHGSRSQADIDRYSAPGFTADKLQWAHETVKPDAVADAEQAASILANAAPEVDTTSHASLVTTAEAALAARVARDLARIKLHICAATELKQGKAAAWAEVDDEVREAHENAMFEKYGPDHLIDSDEDEAAFRKARRKARYAASRAVKREISARYGVATFNPNKPPRLLYKVSLGLGKTSSWQRAAAGTDLSFDFMAPNHDLTGQMFADFLDLGFGRQEATEDDWEGAFLGNAPTRTVMIERGRGGYDEDGNPMCQRYDVVSAAGKAGVKIRTKICAYCPFRETCLYQIQRDKLRACRKAAGVIVSTHAYMTNFRPSDGYGQVVVIDESSHGTFVGSVEIPKASLVDHAQLSALVDNENLAELLTACELIHEAMADHRGAAIDWLAGQTTVERMRAVIKAIDAQMKAPPVHGGMDDARIIKLCEDATNESAPRLLALLRVILRAMKAGYRTLRSIQDGTGKDGKPTFKLSTCKRPRVPKNRPVVVLDATGNLEIVKRIYGEGFELVEISAPELLSITQSTITGSKDRLAGLDPVHRQNLVASLVAFSDGKPCFVATHKDTEGRLAPELPAHIKLCHFGKLRGLNAFKDYDRGVILGRQQAPLDELEAQAAAISLEAGGNVVTMAEYLERNQDKRPALRADRYLPAPDKQGNAAWHPDPLVNALRRSSCEDEIVQAIGRLRGVRAVEPKQVLLITNVALDGYPISQVVPFRQLTKGRTTPCRVDEYVTRMLAKDKLAVLSSDIMHALAPDLFASEEAAKNARKRWGNRGQNLINMIYKNLTPIAGTFRKLGQAGQRTAFLTILSSPILLGVRLREVAGPIAGFELDPEDMSCHANKEVA